jgi:hypothetical protein
MKTETNAPDPALVKAAAHSSQVFDEVYNNDPEALANLFTEKAVLGTDKGIFSRSARHPGISERHFQGLPVQ